MGCSQNNLTVFAGNGPEAEQLRDFVAKARCENSAMSLGHFLPTPKELLEQASPCRDENNKQMNIAKFGSEDWYQWRLKNWGAKREVDATLLINLGGLAVFEFDSVSSPPLRWLTTVSKQFPALYFSLKVFIEEVCRKGNFLVRDGELLGGDITDEETYDDCDPELTEPPIDRLPPKDADTEVDCPNEDPNEEGPSFMWFVE